jgi:hypothetical protein
VVEDRKRCGWGAVVAALALFTTLLLAVPATPAAAAPAGGPVAVVVRHTPDGEAEARGLVRRLGGTVGRPLGIIDGFAAQSRPRRRGVCGPAGPSTR